MSQAVAAARARLLESLFAGDVPPLWCPPLTHYTRDGLIDRTRIAAHWRTMAPYVGGFLIPGSTGDGWELTPVERREVLEIGLDLASELHAHILLGALHPDPGKALGLIQSDLAWLKSRFNESEGASALRRARVCAFTICPPRGKELRQEEISRGLTSVLELGLPTAIYQLPQVTLNEMSPETAADLAVRYPNFMFFKDTSGTDAVALSGKSLAGVFRARGAEGDYARWLKGASGPYDGFLLASANCFARELHQVITDISQGRLEPARQLSGRVGTVVNEVLRLASGLPDGNAFANGNKAMDHFFAYGPGAATVSPPRLHAGSCLPVELLRSTGEILRSQDLMPARGYLE